MATNATSEASTMRQMALPRGESGAKSRRASWASCWRPARRGRPTSTSSTPCSRVGRTGRSGWWWCCPLTCGNGCPPIGSRPWRRPRPPPSGRALPLRPGAWEPGPPPCMSAFVLHPDALTDLTEIWEYIAADNLGAAERVIEEIQEAIRALISRATVLAWSY